LKEPEDLLPHFLKGAKIKSNVIVHTLVGSLGYKQIDPKVTYQYPILQEKITRKPSNAANLKVRKNNKNITQKLKPKP